MSSANEDTVPREEAEWLRRLEEEWQLASVSPDSRLDPLSLDELDWAPARVPGTVAGALGARDDLDERDWWFRTRFAEPAAAVGEKALLHLGGIATVAEVFLNGRLVLESESMFLSYAIDVSDLLRDENELAIRCRALGPLLRVRRRPRARWRTRLVADGNLRFFRTMLLGRAPGFAPGPPTIGPWRAVWIERRTEPALDDLALRPRVEDGDGVLAVDATLSGVDDGPSPQVGVELSGPSGMHRAELLVSPSADGRGTRTVSGELRVPEVALWWPHTHGEPVLHEVRLTAGPADGCRALAHRRVGFRTLSAADDQKADGLALAVNGVATFARGVLWTPADWPGLAPSAGELRTVLERVRDAGMNILRVPGLGSYESDAFHDLCDELGLLVWQDFMFANMDYPIADERFRALVEAEARQILTRVAGRPSLAVLCGNSEVEQQVSMLGLDPELGRGELFGELLPRLAREAGADVPYLPSAPCGGARPFRPDRGVANYFGVGGYRRPLEDVRRAEVRFASECLAFANVPDEVAHPVADPRWKAGVPRDAGSSWDFDDVRDHYLELLFGVDAAELRRADAERYLELSRAASGEVMAEVFGEWRRAASPCAGGLVLWLRDLVAGAGWGVLDERGAPKAALGHLRRVLAPVAVWTTDEGLAGVAVHVANDRPAPLDARLRISLLRGLEHIVDEETRPVLLAGHGSATLDAEEVLGRFVDASWAYRFGPPAQDAIVVSLERETEGGAELLSQTVRFPAGRPASAEPGARLGLEATARGLPDGTVALELTSRRLAYGVRVAAPGLAAAEDGFCVEPGRGRTILLTPDASSRDVSGATVSALNLAGRVAIRYEEEVA